MLVNLMIDENGGFNFPLLSKLKSNKLCVDLAYNYYLRVYSCATYYGNYKRAY